MGRTSGGAPKNRQQRDKAKVGKHVVGTEGTLAAVLSLAKKITGAEQVHVPDAFF